MLFKFEGDLEELSTGINILGSEIGFTTADSGLVIKVEKRPGNLEVKYEDGIGHIRFDKRIHFFRALGLFMEALQLHKNFEIIEEPQFSMNGVMLDLSRNAVMKTDSLKKMLGRMALMGLDTLLLYMEDIYEVEGEPYFGYLRGRYSHRELKECDDYAYIFGIEVIPCIQTLAHLEQFLRWEKSASLRDTYNTLLAGEDRTYAFIEKMIKAASAPFRSRNIHIGMDEANGLGLGKYINKNGYRNRFEIMSGHLKKVVEITSKYQLKPMIWSDMYFRLASKNWDYYDQDAVIPEEIARSIPDDVKIMYWDYYHDKKEFYASHIQKHKALGSTPAFAGGIWTFSGIGTNYGKTFATTYPALEACKEEGVTEVIATIWNDDGAENNIFSALLGLQLYAEYGYSKTLDMEKLKRRVKFCTGIDFNAFMDLKYLDEVPGTPRDNLMCSNPSRYFLWQDILLGLFDRYADNAEIATHFARLEEKMKIYRETYKDFGFIFEVPEKLCSVLKLKCDIGVKVKEYYDKKNLKMLRQIATHILPLIASNVNELRCTHREQWFRTNKPFGWDALDIRYGGILTRIDTAIKRLSDYLDKKIERIDELEEEKLYFFNHEGRDEDDELNSTYKWIATVSI